MKPMTALLVAAGFAAGLAVGMSEPIAKAGSGLARIIGVDTKLAAGPVIRVTATSSDTLLRDGIQPADIRWNVRQDASKSNLCEPNGLTAAAPLPAIQHL